MGYGYGIWFIVKNCYIDELVERFNTKPHIPHLTIMCNMTLQEATRVYDTLKISDFKECMAVPITNLKLMEGNYSDEQEDIAYGLEFSISNWYKWIETIKRIFKGDVPISPHLSIIYRDKEYEYWIKTTTKGNYSIKLRKRIGTEKIEEIWNGDKEKEKLNTEYFGIGDLEVSFNDKYLGYSLDLKGSEYFTIYIRDISTNKLDTVKIEETSGGITFSLDDKYIFYSKLDKFHRPRKIFRHKIGTLSIEDE